MRTRLLLMLVSCLCLVACNRNPVLKASTNKIDALIESSGYQRVAPACAVYYIKGQRIKVTRVSTLCSTFTRELAEQANNAGLVPGKKLTYKNFRDKAFWEAWAKRYPDEVKAVRDRDAARAKNK